MDLNQLSDDALSKVVKHGGDINKAMKEFSDDDLFKVMEISKPKESKKEAGIGEQVGRGLMSAIPAVTAVGGGVIGSGLGPAGAVGGGALGYAAGRTIEKGLKEAVFGDNQGTLAERLGGSAKDVLEGATYEMGGQIVGAAAKAIGPQLSRAGTGLKEAYEYTKATPKGNAAEIIAASKQVGIKPTKGMLTANQLVGELESGLSQSGSIPAFEIRKQQELLGKQLQGATEKLSSQTSLKTSYESGNLSKNLIEDIINKNKTPVSALYDKLEKSFLNIPIDLKVVNKEFGVIKKDPIFKTADGKLIVDRILDDIGGLENLADLKEYRTNLLRSLPNTASDLDKIRIRNIYDKITNIRDNSIAALQIQPEFKYAPNEVKKELSQLVDDIKVADSAHKQNMDFLNKVRHLFGQKEPFRSSTEFVKKMSEIPNQNLTEKVFSSGNVDELKAFSNQFPEAFSQMKIQKFSDMIQKSTNRDGFNFTQFNKNYEKMDPNIRDLVFDKETQSYISALKTVFESLPERLGPSGTPQGLMTMSGINPQRILQDMWSKYVYKNSTPQGVLILQSLGQRIGNIGEGMTNINQLSTIPIMTRAIPETTAVQRRMENLNQGVK